MLKRTGNPGNKEIFNTKIVLDVHLAQFQQNNIRCRACEFILSMSSGTGALKHIYVAVSALIKIAIIICMAELKN
jgi:hypothetical protein